MNVVSSDEECSDNEYDLMRVHFITGLAEDELECRPGEPGWENYVRVVGLRSGNDGNGGGIDNGETNEEEEEEEQEDNEEEDDDDDVDDNNDVDDDDDNDDNEEEDDEEEFSEEEEYDEEEDDEEEDDEEEDDDMEDEGEEWIMEKAPMHEIVTDSYMNSLFRCTKCRSLGSEFLPCCVCGEELGGEYLNVMTKEEFDEYMQMTWTDFNIVVEGKCDSY